MRRRLGLPLLALTTLSVAMAQPIERKEGVSFSNIAPGELESDQVRSMPVKVTFASETGKPYAGVYVRIFNASGIAVFKHLCEKPLLFVKLPAGEYNLIAVDRKKVQKTVAFAAPREGERQKVVTLKWPQEAVGY